MRNLVLLSIAMAWSVMPGVLFAGESVPAENAPPMQGTPLHRQVDAMIARQAAGQPVAPLAGDAEFLRRVYLDLAGRTPSSQELQAFLADSRPEKRAALVQALLNGADYPRRMQDLFHAMLMERRGDNPEWRTFLKSAFEANEPWDQLARDILDPETEDPAKRGAAFFYTRRLDKVGTQETDYPGLTRDVGRLFLGMDLQCAQCHNHLFIDDYKQQDFQGLFVVFQNTSIRRDVKHPAIAEKVLTKKIEFMSVFDKIPLAVGPRVPGGQELVIPTFEKGQEYLVPPDRKKNFPGIPRFSPLEAVAHELPTAKNAAFARNIANRLWFVMMGRGLVHPLDQHHSANPPSHPAILELLSHEIVAHQFDIRWLLGELAISETYQRSSIPPAGAETPPQSFLTGNEKRLSAEQLMASMLQATGPWPKGNAAEPQQDAEPTPAPAAGAGNKKKPAAKESPEAQMQTAFLKAFGNPPQEPEVEFNPSLKSALFLLNNPLVLDLLTPKHGNLMDRAASLADAAVADELYRSILTRDPTDEERTAATDYLAKHGQRRAAALADLAWSLLASTEFAVNH